MTKRILITPGEPAGIGPDISIQIAQQAWPHELVAVADPALLNERAKKIGLQIQLIETDINADPTPHQPGTLKIIPITLHAAVTPGQLNTSNANYVLQTLQTAADICLNQQASAIVTGPVNKAVINDAGFSFAGHTEFFAAHCHVPQTVMLFVADNLKVALVTTHLPLSAVPTAITQDRLLTTLAILQTGLQQQFQIKTPRILVCGLNPHAGEEGHLGREEIDVIAPALAILRKQHYQILGPLSADTIFTPKYTDHADVVVAMFHDQALPLVKYKSFGHAVNVTLGLPFIRTSVDHGTALDIAGTGMADPGSMQAAIQLAMTLQHSHR
jgi:4-hydroxythreonine-4-phosphate dehydrogenase